MIRRAFHLLPLALLSLFAIGPPGAYAGGIAPYSVTDLGSLGGPGGTSASGLNNLGQVVGISGGVPFLYRDGVMRAIDSEGLGFPTLINDSGQFAYSGERYQQISINASGVTVGVLNDGDQLRPAMSSGGAVTPLDGPDAFGVGGRARAINDRGQIVGEKIYSPYGVGTGSAYHPVLVSNGRATDLGLLPGAFGGVAQAINNRGQIVGDAYFGPAIDSSRAFLYAFGKLTDLGTLGGRWSSAGAINSLGVILGSSETSDGLIHAFLYQDGSMTDLTQLLRSTTGLDLRPTRLNDSGQILAQGAIDGSEHAILLTPNSVPEPGAIFPMIAIGAITVLHGVGRVKKGALRPCGFVRSGDYAGPRTRHSTKA